MEKEDDYQVSTLQVALAALLTSSAHFLYGRRIRENGRNFVSTIPNGQNLRTQRRLHFHGTDTSIANALLRIRDIFRWSSLFLTPMSVISFALSQQIQQLFCCCSLLLISLNGLGSHHLHNGSFFVLVSRFLLYSFIVANAFIIYNLALVSSTVEEHSGFLVILKACVLLRGRTLAGITLAVVVNLALVAIEALFHYRFVRAYHGSGGLTSFSMALEGILIAYLYSIFVVVDSIVSFMFFKSWKTSC